MIDVPCESAFPLAWPSYGFPVMEWACSSVALAVSPSLNPAQPLHTQFEFQVQDHLSTFSEELLRCSVSVAGHPNVQLGASAPCLVC